MTDDPLQAFLFSAVQVLANDIGKRNYAKPSHLSKATDNASGVAATLALAKDFSHVNSAVTVFN